MIYKFLVKSKRFGQGNMQKEKFTFYKKGISYVLLLFLINTVSPCFAEVQKDFYISAEEILQTQGTPPDVSFTNKI